MGTKIAYVDEVWNPVVGCTKCSPGCDKCYAEKMAIRLSSMGHEKYQRVVTAKAHSPGGKQKWNGTVFCDEKALGCPLHWRKPRRILCCSMGDLFHESVPFEFIEKVIDTTLKCPQHKFLILTKRPDVMLEYSKGMDEPEVGGEYTAWDDNVYLGVTICTQKEADEILPVALQIPGFDWISAEPLLSDIDFHQSRSRKDIIWRRTHGGNYQRKFLRQIVVGGESGPGARPMHPAWPRHIRDQCIAAGIPFFFKQWGEWGPVSNYIPANRKRYFCFDPPSKATPQLKEYNGLSLANMYRYGKKKAGRLLDGKLWDQRI